MAAYLVVDLDIFDQSTWEEYRKAVGPTLEQYGGRVIAGRNGHEVLEGDWNPRTLLILEFPTTERAKAWYDSPEYRVPKATRQRAARTNLLLVPGV